MTTPESGLREAVQRKGSFLQTMRAVAWSFFGVRKSSEYEKDLNQLNPVHVVKFQRLKDSGQCSVDGAESLRIPVSRARLAELREALGL